MADDIPAIRPTQFEGDSIGRLAKSVNMARGDLNLVKDLVSLPGRPGDSTLAVTVGIQCESNVSLDAVRWNLDAPTGVLGLGWSMPRNRIYAESTGSLTAASRSYVMEVDGVAGQLVADTLRWVRATIDAATTSSISAGTVTPVLVQALARQGLRLSPKATVTTAPDGDGWLLADDDLERELRVVTTTSGADVVDGGSSFQLQSYQFWKIAYYPRFERWEVTTDVGEVRAYGGGLTTTTDGFRASSGNSIGWAVKWGGPDGNRVGPSAVTVTQAQYASEWNLASRSDRWGSTVLYGYNEPSGAVDRPAHWSRCRRVRHGQRRCNSAAVERHRGMCS